MVTTFPAGDHRAEQSRQHDRHEAQTVMIKDPQKKYSLGTVSKNIFTEELKLVFMYKP